MSADKTELRGLCPVDLAQALDAIAHAEGMDRNGYIVQILDAHVKVIAHKQILLGRMLKGNTYLTQADGRAPE